MRKFFTRIFIIILISTLVPQLSISQDLGVSFQKDTVLKNITTIKVKGYYCKVLVKKNNDNAVKLHAVLKSDQSDGYKLITKITNHVLDVWVSFPESWKSRAGELVFYVPDSVKLDIENTSGYCTVNEVNAKNINVITKSGKITINKCSANIMASTVSGEVYIDEVTGSVSVRSKSSNIYLYRIKGDVAANTSKGKIHLDNITGNVKTASSSGEQELENIEGDILAKSLSGKIKISVAEGKIQVLGGSGDVQLFQTKGIHEIKTTKGSQTGTRILLTGASKFTSTEGKIKMRFENPKEQITYKLVSEKAFVFALGKSKKKKLNVGKGSILVEAYSTTGSLAFY
ncbi:MAG: DUF4097 family beta strand repeat protein [Chlorobi bacterium]|nr:DUF4097 family beta strand repeat protein [Chlorobiota bacterium]